MRYVPLRLVKQLAVGHSVLESAPILYRERVVTDIFCIAADWGQAFLKNALCHFALLGLIVVEFALVVSINTYLDIIRI